jgi:release factor glutamine methyltransferase
MKTIFRFIQEQLRDSYSDAEIKSFSYLILESVCNMDKSSVLRHKDKQLSLNEYARIHEIVEELKKYHPIQYILGETEFYGLKFKVDANVLIPRPETEELVEWVIKEMPPPSCHCVLNLIQDHPKSLEYNILDIGTGSGCIAITLAKHLSGAEVYALDISEKALNVARQNAAKNQVNVRFFQHDILKDEPLDFPFSSLVFDCIVSNPPYITLKEKAAMSKNVLDYEPHQALFVPQENPLLFYERIAGFARNYLKESGSLYLETNSLYGRVSAKLLENEKFRSVRLLKDISGNDRIIIAKL